MIFIRACLIKKLKVKINNFVKLIFISLVFTFLIHICFYALSTFLFLLVYPTKVITVLAYMITLFVVATVMFSVSIRLTIQRYHTMYHDLHRSTFLISMMYILIMIIYCIGFLILLFTIVIILLYALVFGEASAISTGLYAVLSLIPTAVISFVSWMFKNKVFSNTNSAKMEDKNKESEEKKNDNIDKEQSATNTGEVLTICVNENTPINGNDHEIKIYGAAGGNN